MPRAKQRTPELRSHVLESALALLDGQGVRGLTARAVAERAGTSVPAVYELYGDKAGLVRAVYFEGFRRLADELDSTPTTDDPTADLLATAQAYRRFVQGNGQLAEVMLARPFLDFDPGPDEREASARGRRHVVQRVRRCLDAGVLDGDAEDIALAVSVLVQGLAMAERARRLGSSARSVDRRWDLALTSLLRGMAPAQPG